MDKIKEDLRKMSLFDVETLRAFIHKKYSGLFMMGSLMPMPGIKEKADKYCIILKACEEIYEEKENEYLNHI